MYAHTTKSVDFTKLRFLVTGGAGFIGSHLVGRLVSEGAQVRVLDLFTSGQPENLADVRDRIELIKGDIADLETVRRVVAGTQYVIHLAALVSVPESMRCPQLNFSSNIAGTYNILLAAHEARVQRLIFPSTCGVYGEHIIPHHEALAPCARSPYSAAKLSGEYLCQSFAHVHKLPTVCLRYFNVFGPRQNVQSGYAAVIPKFIIALLQGERPQIYGDGYQIRDFVYVDDVVEATLLACHSEAAVGGTFNIGTAQETSIRTLLRILGEIAEQEITPLFLPARLGDVRDSCSDITRARTVLNYQPTIGLYEGLCRTFAWYRQHHENLKCLTYPVASHNPDDSVYHNLCSRSLSA